MFVTHLEVIKNTPAGSNCFASTKVFVKYSLVKCAPVAKSVEGVVNSTNNSGGGDAVLTVVAKSCLHTRAELSWQDGQITLIVPDFVQEGSLWCLDIFSIDCVIHSVCC